MKRKGSILIVDDEAEHITFYRKLLSDDGFDVKSAINSSEAYKWMENTTFDIILLDIVLRNESGFDILKKVKDDARFDLTMVIMISGALISSEQQAKGLELGADGYITRPLGAREFLARMNAFMRHIKTLAALKKSEERFQKIINKNPDAIMIVEPSGQIKFANPAAEKLFELSMDVLLQHLFGYPLVVGENAEINIVRKNKEEVVGEMRTIDIEWDGLDTFLTTIRNITDKKKLWEALMQAKEKAEESEKLKAAFLANMSHEIRTPMNGILGFTNLLKDNHFSEEDQANYIEIIEKSGERLLNIINDLISISKVEAGQMEVFVSKTNLKEVLDYILTFFKPETDSKGLYLKQNLQVSPEGLVVNTDREKLYAILTNLVKNAIKYTESGGIEIGVARQNRRVDFYIKDTGIGIPNDRKDAVFERFVQADIADVRALQGAGLGLAITKAYVEMLGGKIWLESSVGQGSTFYFNLFEKASADLEIKKEETKSDSTNKIKKMNILIAEDDETSEMILSLFIKRYCNKLYRAGNGLDAVKLCRENPDIDIIFMDMKMPLMNGYEATREIRTFNQKVIIIAQTAYGLSGDSEKAIEVGCNHYLSKPIIREELYELLGKYQSHDT